MSKRTRVHDYDNRYARIQSELVRFVLAVFVVGYLKGGLWFGVLFAVAFVVLWHLFVRPPRRM